MRVAISQPTYLPWLGYFDLIDQVDAFVFLDSVQFERQSWHHRNRIKTPAGLQWLTIPVAFRGRFGQQIADVAIRDADFSRKHVRAIELNYRRAPFFNDYFPELCRILHRAQADALLVDLNLEIIRWICAELQIRTLLFRSSTLRVEGRRSELLISICKQLGANSYLSPRGSAAYLLDDLALFTDAAIEVEFHSFHHPEYRQMFPPFLPFSSAIDVLFNEGTSAREILCRGRGLPIAPGQLVSDAVVQAGIW